MTLYHHLGREARHLPTTCEARQKSWMRRSPSVASAPEKSNNASRARRARPRHGPHSCAMTVPTRTHRPGSPEPPAGGVWRSGAGRPWPRRRAGDQRAQVRPPGEGPCGAQAPGSPFSDLRGADTAFSARGFRLLFTHPSASGNTQRLAPGPEPRHTSQARGTRQPMADARKRLDGGS